MQRYPAEAVIEHMIKEASEGNGSRKYRNPKDTFDEMEENGNFVSLPRKTINQKRINCQELGDMLWAGRSYASVFEILVRAMSSSAVSSRARKTIAGFMTDKFTSEDLVKYAGVRNEIAGRIERIVQLSPMDADSLYQILIDPEMSPITELTKRYGKKLELSEFMKRRIAKEAADSHLGVRYMRSRIKALMEDRIFEDDESEGYRISC